MRAGHRFLLLPPLSAGCPRISTPELEARGGELQVDGRIAELRSPSLPAVVQPLDEAGTVTLGALLAPGGPFPACEPAAAQVPPQESQCGSHPVASSG